MQDKMLMLCSVWVNIFEVPGYKHRDNMAVDTCLGISHV